MPQPTRINILKRDELGELFEEPVAEGAFQNLKRTQEIAEQVVTKKPTMTQLLGDAAPLKNRKDPYYEVKHERTHHRVFLELAAKGYTVKEIAEQTGFSPVCVNNVLRQQHSQQLLVNEIRDIHSVDEQVVTVIKENAVFAVQTLANIVKNEDAKGSDRIAAANALLDRRYGKPNQPINRGTDVDLIKLTDAELAAMLPTNGTGTTP